MNVWESMKKALQQHAVYKKLYFFTASHARIRISTTSHTRIRIRYCKSCALMKSKVRMIKSLSPQYQAIPEKNITRLLPLASLLVLCTRNSTDGNKLRIFSGIALYYGDTYIVTYCTHSDTDTVHSLIQDSIQLNLLIIRSMQMY